MSAGEDPAGAGRVEGAGEGPAGVEGALDVRASPGEPEALFAPDGAERYVPSGHARGPWDPDAMHGGAPSALLARAVQALAPDLQVARLTFDFLGPVALEPVTVRARLLRPGRRLAIAEGELSVGGRVALVVRAGLLARDHVTLPPGAAVAPTPEVVEPPELAVPTPFRAGGVGGPAESLHATGMEVRTAGGTDLGPGPALAWMRLVRPLVAGAPTPAVCRAVVAADFGNGVSRVLAWEDHTFANTDLTVCLLRDPVGPWVLLDARSVVEATGVGAARSTLHDERGPIGSAHQTLFVREHRGFAASVVDRS